MSALWHEINFTATFLTFFLLWRTIAGTMTAINNLSEVEKEGTRHNKIVLLFSAPWCGPCKMIKPMVESKSASASTPVFSVNVDEAQDVAAHFNVRTVPTAIVLKGTEVCDMRTGAGQITADWVSETCC